MCTWEVCLLPIVVGDSFLLATPFPALPLSIYSFSQTAPCSPPPLNNRKEHSGNSTQSWTKLHTTTLLYKLSAGSLCFICSYKGNWPTTVFIIPLNWISVTKPRDGVITLKLVLAIGSWSIFEKLWGRHGYNVDVTNRGLCLYTQKYAGKRP